MFTSTRNSSSSGMKPRCLPSAGTAWVHKRSSSSGKWLTTNDEQGHHEWCQWDAAGEVTPASQCWTGRWGRRSWWVEHGLQWEMSSPWGWVTGSGLASPFFSHCRPAQEQLLDNCQCCEGQHELRDFSYTSGAIEEAVAARAVLSMEHKEAHSIMWRGSQTCFRADGCVLPPATLVSWQECPHSGDRLVILLHLLASFSQLLS